ncbi:hydrogenase maturation protease [Bacteroidota bacterium]
MINKILLLGVGNDILTDDGIGPRLIKNIKDTGVFKKVDGIEFETLCVGGLEILEYIKDFETVIIIDAIRTRGGIPGTIYLLTPDDFKETLHLSSFHDVSFLTAIELGHKLGYYMPSKIKIIAIEIIEDLVFSEEFTPELKEKYPEILAEVKEIIQKEIVDQS